MPGAHHGAHAGLVMGRGSVLYIRSVRAHCLLETDPPPLCVCRPQICRETCTPHKRFRCRECWQARLDESKAIAAAEAPQRNLDLLIRPALHRALQSLRKIADVDDNDGGAGLADFMGGMHKGKFDAQMAAAMRDARRDGSSRDEVAELLRQGAQDAGLSSRRRTSAPRLTLTHSKTRRGRLMRRMLRHSNRPVAQRARVALGGHSQERGPLVKSRGAGPDSLMVRSV